MAIFKIKDGKKVKVADLAQSTTADNIQMTKAEDSQSVKESFDALESRLDVAESNIKWIYKYGGTGTGSGSGNSNGGDLFDSTAKLSFEVKQNGEVIEPIFDTSSNTYYIYPTVDTGNFQVKVKVTSNMSNSKFKYYCAYTLDGQTKLFNTSPVSVDTELSTNITVQDITSLTLSGYNDSDEVVNLDKIRLKFMKTSLAISGMIDKQDFIANKNINALNTSSSRYQLFIKSQNSIIGSNSELKLKINDSDEMVLATFDSMSEQLTSIILSIDPYSPYLYKGKANNIQISLRSVSKTTNEETGLRTVNFKYTIIEDSSTIVITSNTLSDVESEPTIMTNKSNINIGYSFICGNTSKLYKTKIEIKDTTGHTFEQEYENINKDNCPIVQSIDLTASKIEAFKNAEGKGNLLTVKISAAFPDEDYIEGKNYAIFYISYIPAENELPSIFNIYGNEPIAQVMCLQGSKEISCGFDEDKTQIKGLNGNTTGFVTYENINSLRCQVNNYLIKHFDSNVRDVLSSSTWVLSLSFKADSNQSASNVLFQLGEKTKSEEVERGITVYPNKIVLKMHGETSQLLKGGNYYNIDIVRYVVNETTNSGTAYREIFVVYVNGCMSRFYEGTSEYSVNQNIFTANSDVAMSFGSDINGKNCSDITLYSMRLYNTSVSSPSAFLDAEKKIVFADIVNTYHNALINEYEGRDNELEEKLNDILAKNYISIIDGKFKSAFYDDIDYINSCDQKRKGRYDASAIYNRLVEGDTAIQTGVMLIKTSQISNDNETKAQTDLTSYENYTKLFPNFDKFSLRAGATISVKIPGFSVSTLEGMIAEGQGTSSSRYFGKNIDISCQKIALGDDNEAQPIFSIHPNMLPDSTITLKADVVDSSHSNNASIGHFVNDIWMERFKDRGPLADTTYEYRDKIKTSTYSEPMLVFMEFPGDANIYFLGLYNCITGRKSFYNLGLKKLELTDSGKAIYNGNNSAYKLAPNTDFIETTPTGVFEDAGSYECSENLPAELIGFQSVKEDCLIGNLWKDVYTSGDSQTTFKSFVNIISQQMPDYEYNWANVNYAVKDAKGFWRPDSRSGTYSYKYTYEYDSTDNNQHWKKCSFFQPQDNLYQERQNTEEIARIQSYINSLCYVDEFSMYLCVAYGLGMIDSLVKNLTVRTWLKKVHPRFYDMDGGLSASNDTAILPPEIFVSNYYESENGLGLLQYTYFKDKVAEYLTYDDKTQTYVKHEDGWKPSNPNAEGTIARLDASEISYQGCYSRLWEFIENKSFTSSSYGNDYSPFQQDWANFRNDFLRNGKSFVNNYFRKNYDSCGNSIFNFNYREKYFPHIGLTQVISDGVVVNEIPDASQMFYGNKVDYVEDWLDKHLAYVDGCLNVGGYIKAINGETVNIKPLSPSDIPETSYFQNVTSPRLVNKQQFTVETDYSLFLHIGVGSNEANQSVFITKAEEEKEISLSVAIKTDTVANFYGAKHYTVLRDFQGFSTLTSGFSGLFELSSTNDNKGLAMVSLSDYVSLRDLAIANCSSTSSLTCDLSNSLKLRKVDITNSTAIKTLTLPPSVGSLETLNVSRSGIQTLKVNGSSMLTRVEIVETNSLTSINFTNCPNLSEIIIDINPITSQLATINIENCGLTNFTINGLPQITNVTLSACKELKTVKVTNCATNEKPSKLIQISGCDKLESIDLSNSKFTNLTLSNKASLRNLNIKTLNLSNTNIGYIKYGTNTNDSDTLFAWEDDYKNTLIKYQESEDVACDVMDLSLFDLSTTTVNLQNTPIEYLVINNPSSEEFLKLKSLTLSGCKNLKRAFGKFVITNGLFSNLPKFKLNEGFAETVANGSYSLIYKLNNSIEDSTNKDVTKIKFDESLTSISSTFTNTSASVDDVLYFYQIVIPRHGNITSISSPFAKVNHSDRVLFQAADKGKSVFYDEGLFSNQCYNKVTSLSAPLPQAAIALTKVFLEKFINVTTLVAATDGSKVLLCNDSFYNNNLVTKLALNTNNGVSVTTYSNFPNIASFYPFNFYSVESSSFNASTRKKKYVDVKTLLNNKPHLQSLTFFTGGSSAGYYFDFDEVKGICTAFDGCPNLKSLSHSFSSSFIGGNITHLFNPNEKDNSLTTSSNLTTLTASFCSMLVNNDVKLTFKITPAVFANLTTVSTGLGGSDLASRITFNSSSDNYDKYIDEDFSGLILNKNAVRLDGLLSYTNVTKAVNPNIQVDLLGWMFGNGNTLTSLKYIDAFFANLKIDSSVGVNASSNSRNKLFDLVGGYFMKLPNVVSIRYLFYGIAPYIDHIPYFLFYQGRTPSTFIENTQNFVFGTEEDGFYLQSKDGTQYPITLEENTYKSDFNGDMNDLVATPKWSQTMYVPKKSILYMDYCFTSTFATGSTNMENLTPITEIDIPYTVMSDYNKYNLGLSTIDGKIIFDEYNTSYQPRKIAYDKYKNTFTTRSDYNPNAIINDVYMEGLPEDTDKIMYSQTGMLFPGDLFKYCQPNCTVTYALAQGSTGNNGSICEMTTYTSMKENGRFINGYIHPYILRPLSKTLALTGLFEKVRFSTYSSNMVFDEELFAKLAATNVNYMFQGCFIEGSVKPGAIASSTPLISFSGGLECAVTLDYMFANARTNNFTSFTGIVLPSTANSATYLLYQNLTYGSMMPSSELNFQYIFTSLKLSSTCNVHSLLAKAANSSGFITVGGYVYLPEATKFKNMRNVNTIVANQPKTAFKDQDLAVKLGAV